MVRLPARADLSDRDRAVDEAVRPGAIDIEEANRFVGQKAGIRHEIIERHADQEPQMSEKRFHIGRHRRLGDAGVDLVRGGEPLAQRVRGTDRNGSHHRPPSLAAVLSNACWRAAVSRPNPAVSPITKSTVTAGRVVSGAAATTAPNVPGSPPSSVVALAAEPRFQAVASALGCMPGADATFARP